MKKYVYLIFLLITFVSCNQSNKKTEYVALQKKASMLFGTLPIQADNPENEITEEKVALGQKLYFDNRLSKDNTQSCNTCHNLKTFGVDNLSTSPGNNGGLGTRNSPTVLNAALHTDQFWDGREPDVEAQAGGPILNPVEMAMPSEEIVVERLLEDADYLEMFGLAFPADQEPISYKNIQKAIGAFERKLITPSRFDDFLAGDLESLNEKELYGLQIFMDNGCTACHSGNALGGNVHQKFGLFDDYWHHTKSENIDKGKFEVTNNEGDKYIFKSPSLRNIAKTYPYFHDGSVHDLEDAVAIMGKIQLNKDFTAEELEAMVAFLNSLTGELPEEIKNAL
ncbi:cytochrome C peroxidase [Pseudalgibacter alginicilyticus]|uniref:Cytochrome C peroxidase n=1 Tax=Pseudalgibacter alginicilyticus TaxID=1736674 RepID=A0A0P0D5N0_9FLAO|nr:cytochrome-c peroxidase [Pseudalgibacter alginicilyticus]ALJ03955.1 cytochrome C peroxidase [Pseudalgibacter alginicilyticus]